MAHNPLDILGFTRDVARSLILCNKSTTRNATGRLPSKVNRVPEDVRLDQQKHYLTPGPTQRRCIFCGRKTMKLCIKCPNAPIHKDCFATFHSNK
ncbi:PiggyBac transposable element-derived protein 3-like [Plakobranchus ocellatus]|uniref:PiggyBac transposable element-derived protein 3-like n=1 Tax=Plakobranchus ocellatus TaxID=259542 RepID=A0AAV4CLE8_9GAST|nr:PiggyBac transposable element-derived protein 3-like [Plakobranchus ocellatus]